MAWSGMTNRTPARDRLRSWGNGEARICGRCDVVKAWRTPTRSPDALASASCDYFETRWAACETSSQAPPCFSKTSISKTPPVYSRPSSIRGPGRRSSTLWSRITQPGKWALRIWRPHASDLQHQLAEILACEKLEQRLGKVSKPRHDVLPRLQFALAEPAAHDFRGVGETVGVIEYQHSVHARAVDQREEIVARALDRRRVVILRDRAADDDAGVICQIGERRVEDFAAESVRSASGRRCRAS
jgi:hypothetical protein